MPVNGIRPASQVLAPVNLPRTPPTAFPGSGALYRGWRLRCRSALDLLLIYWSVFQAVGACAGIILSRAIRPRSPFRPSVNALVEWSNTGFFVGPGSCSSFWRASCCMAWMASDLRIRCQLRLRCICRHASSSGNEKGPAAPIKVKAIFATYKSVLTSKSYIIPNMVAAALIASMFAFMVSAAPIFVKGLQLSPALAGCFPAVAVSDPILGASLARWAATGVQPARTVRVGRLFASASSIAMASIPISAPCLLAAISFFCLGFGLALLCRLRSRWR
jgi:DHA1 family bicyclomycin/chloramphenicol resistance-like MFS transporter